MAEGAAGVSDDDETFDLLPSVMELLDTVRRRGDDKIAVWLLLPRSAAPPLPKC